MAAASAKLFAYTWFYTSTGRYRPLEELAASAFQFAAVSNGLALSDGAIRSLVDAYSQLDLWSDVPAAIDRLRGAGMRLAVLSNLSEDAIRKNLARGSIADAFHQVLSTDRIAHYKPAPEAYHMGESALGLRREQIAFAASAGWDATGATWFGYPSVWVNRANAPAEHANVPPLIVSEDIQGVLRISGQGLNE